MLLSVVFGHLQVFGCNALGATRLLQQNVFMSLDLIRHRDDLLLHLVNRLVQLLDVLEVLGPHGLLPLAGLLHNQILLLDVLKLLGLGFLLKSCLLATTLLNLDSLRLHHFDLVE